MSVFGRLLCALLPSRLWVRNVVRVRALGAQSPAGLWEGTSEKTVMGPNPSGTLCWC